MKKIKKRIGMVLIVLGLSLFIIEFIVIKKEKVLENNKLSNTLDSIVLYKSASDDLYNAILSIPKINLRKGIYDIDDVRNNVEDNVMIDKNSIYPDNYPSNVILTAHSGISSKAYFDDLKFLDEDSLIEFYYNHVKYVYKIDHYYYVDKTGKIKLDYDYTKKTITLITCSNIDKQVVYIGYLIDEIEY